VIIAPGESQPISTRSNVVQTTRPRHWRSVLSPRECREPETLVPLHVHHRTDEAFYVLEGELSVQIGQRHVKAPAGAMVLVPRGTMHRYANEGSSPARFLVIISPAGFEQYFVERAALRQSTSDGLLSGEQEDALLSRHDMEWLAPTSSRATERPSSS
jgi:mannose-6-phosphate isomerase-like protein (cupin superfamily)